MTLKINHEKKIISVFLANEETYSPAQISHLPGDVIKKYTLAIFYSGKGDLVKLTGELLKHNL